MVRAGLEDKGQTVSKDVRVEQKVSVALLASRDASCSGGGSEDETIADRAVRYEDIYRMDEIKSLSFHIMFYRLFRDVAKYIVYGTFSSFG